MATKDTEKSSKGSRTKSQASGAKKTTGKSSSNKAPASKKASSKTSAKKKEAVQEELSFREGMPPELNNELILLSTLVVSLLLFLSNFSLSGKFGEIINGVTFGLFGFLAYPIPFLLFFGIAFYLANHHENKRYIGKLLASLGLFVVIAAMIQLAFGEEAESIAEYYKYASEHKSGGGFFGGLLCMLFLPAFGKAGSYVVLVALTLLFIMLLTGKALFALLADYGTESAKRHREQRMLRQEEERERREAFAELSEQEQVRAQSFLLKPENEREEKAQKKPPKKNFFGGISPTAPVGKETEDSTEVEQPMPWTAETQGMGERKTDEYKAEEQKRESYVTEAYVQAVPSEPLMDKATEELVYNGTYKPSKETVDTVNSIYEEELRKKFDHVLEDPKEPVPVLMRNKATYIKEPLPLGSEEPQAEPNQMGQPAEPEEALHSENSMEQSFYVDSKEEQNTYSENTAEPVPYYNDMPEPRAVDPFEPSFSEQSLSDRRRMEAAPREKTIFERAPYGMGQNSETNRNSSVSTGSVAENVVSGRNSTSVEQKNMQTEGQIGTPLQIESGTVPMQKPYEFPPIDLLAKPVARTTGNSDAELHATADKLKNTLESFGVGVTITNVSRGPSVTRYELQPEQGVKVSKITNLADDIKLNLAAADVRIEAPIPGKAAVGIEVPNKENTAVLLRELIEGPEFVKHPSDIAFTVGKDIGGQNIVADIGKMPHLLIAGATGSGKSVCINTIIMSILYKANPADVKLIMVDPKVVELSVYNGIPHLMIPVVTDPKKASAALNWAVAEMTDRYQKFAELSVRDLKGYNERVETLKKEDGLTAENYPVLPRIVIIVDELADLMMVAPGEVEDAICRLAQMARAAGLHLILATQRPSVNVITGLIKANVPSRIAFAVSSGIDSRTILDAVGAEKLLGKGDMLFFPSGYPKPVRIQGAFVSDKEVSAVVDFLKKQNVGSGTYNEEIANRIASGVPQEGTGALAGNSDSGRDEYFAEAGRFIIEKDKASIGMLQRVYKIGFNRAARIMDQLSEAGIVGPEEGTKPRKILMTQEEFEQFLQNN